MCIRDRLCTEWIHRGSLGAGFWKDNFLAHLNSYLLTWLFFLFLYLLAAGLTRLPCVGVLVTGLAGCVPATITYYKLKMRGEPFFPWEDVYKRQHEKDHRHPGRRL